MVGFNFEGIRVHWFPLHMRKAMENIRKGMKEVEVVIEVRDARIPISSQNQRFEHMFYGKERIIVYNKSDLSDCHQNKVRIFNLLT